MPSTATSILDGLSTSVAVKAPCRVVAITNITLAGEQTVNGVAVVEGDRVLVIAQTSSVDNGIYTVSTGVWSRAKDFDGNRDVVKGTMVPITTESNIFYRVTSANPIVIGTSAITFEATMSTLTRPDVETLLYTTTQDGYLAQYLSDRTITLHADYAFLDDSTINFASGGVIGHASFATRIRYVSNQNDDHHHCFQSRPLFNFPGNTLTRWAGYWCQGEMTDGTIDEVALFKGLNPIKTGGTINTLYGLYLSDLNQGTANFAIWTDGVAPSRFGRVLAGPASHTGGAAVSIAHPTDPACSWYSVGAAVDEKFWDQYVDPSGSFHFRLASDDLLTTGDVLRFDRTGVSTWSAVFISPTAADQTLAIHNTAAAGNNSFINFGTEASFTSRGSITYNRGGGVVAYNTSSDVRLKENIEDAPSAGAVIDALQVRSFDFKENGVHVEYGFVAQELNEVAPIAVTPGDTGEQIERAWGIDPSKLVPMLVKEIQELRARVAALESA